MLKVLAFLIPVFCYAFEIYKKINYEELIKELERARIIYIGEIHTREDIHEFQLRIIKDLHERGYELIILMEAFQQQFQDVIDEYINCEIDEEELLERTEYFKRWKFNKELYAPIWRFAKENSIKLYALNVPSELLKEVREKGLENVKSRYLPPKIPPLKEEYKNFLEEFLKKHKGSEPKRFFDVQNTWDTGMAYRIAKLSIAYPKHKLIVLVGSGHVWKGYGIPERVNFLLGEIPQAVLYFEKEKFYFLFSKDFSKETSSENSISEPKGSP